VGTNLRGLWASMLAPRSGEEIELTAAVATVDQMHLLGERRRGYREHAPLYLGLQRG
jgi:hypothetical protein